jgi:hypothetical protein
MMIMMARRRRTGGRAGKRKGVGDGLVVRLLEERTAIVIVIVGC